MAKAKRVSFVSTRQGSKFTIFFGAEPSGGAEVSENFDFFFVLDAFSRKIAQEGAKRSHNAAPPRSGAAEGTIKTPLHCSTNFEPWTRARKVRSLCFLCLI